MASASYLTAEGAVKLKEELEYLKGSARHSLSLRLRHAIEQGDLSENADYTAAKEEQGFLEGRIQELENVLRNVIIIDDTVQTSDSINIGAKITIQEGSFEEETYFLVGPKEADPENGRISYESPLGKSLIGHKMNEVVDVETPNGSMKFKIIKINY